MQEIFDNVEKAFASFRTVDVLLIILFAAVFYYVFRVLKMNNVRSVIVVFALFIIVTGIIFASDVNLKGDVFMVIPLVLAGLILVIFNVEVKRDILNLNTLNRLSEKREHPVYATKDEVERYISEIIRALQNLSKDNILHFYECANKCFKQMRLLMMGWAIKSTCFGVIYRIYNSKLNLPRRAFHVVSRMLRINYDVKV